MSYFSKISVYTNFINKIMCNNFLNLCDKCFIICFFNPFFTINNTDNKNHRKNNEDYDSYIIEINERQ